MPTSRQQASAAAAVGTLPQSAGAAAAWCLTGPALRDFEARGVEDRMAPRPEHMLSIEEPRSILPTLARGPVSTTRMGSIENTVESAADTSKCRSTTARGAAEVPQQLQKCRMQKAQLPLHAARLPLQSAKSAACKCRRLPLQLICRCLVAAECRCKLTQVVPQRRQRRSIDLKSSAKPSMYTIEIAAACGSGTAAAKSLCPINTSAVRSGTIVDMYRASRGCSTVQHGESSRRDYKKRVRLGVLELFEANVHTGTWTLESVQLKCMVVIPVVEDYEDVGEQGNKEDYCDILFKSNHGVTRDCLNVFFRPMNGVLFKQGGKSYKDRRRSSQRLVPKGPDHDKPWNTTENPDAGEGGWVLGDDRRRSKRKERREKCCGEHGCDAKRREWNLSGTVIERQARHIPHMRFSKRQQRAKSSLKRWNITMPKMREQISTGKRLKNINARKTENGKLAGLGKASVKRTGLRQGKGKVLDISGRYESVYVRREVARKEVARKEVACEDLRGKGNLKEDMLEALEANKIPQRRSQKLMGKAR
ncbi:hypothetical protein C8R46DRAFT_1042771 [Mycena filopes]|nr:hypothetical protein C8R46DRAFT_1042771 [Mycena filopes]